MSWDFSATLHEHLSSKIHMEVLLSKIRIPCSIVHKIRNHLSQRILLLLYNSMIKSNLQHCIMTWCNGNKTMVKKLQSSVNKFIKLMFKLIYRDSVKTLTQQYDILTIYQLQELETTNSSPMDCHLNVVGKFEFSMILRATPSVVFNHFHQGHSWR